MTPERERAAAYSALKSNIDQEFAMVERTLAGLRELHRDFPHQSTGHILRAEASYIHDLYTCAENMFRAVADELNGGIPKGEQWHKKLLVEMKADLQPARGPVISQLLFKLLDECLRFRHLIRNSYGVLFDPAKTRDVALIALKAAALLRDELSRFVETIRP